jgi:hypothetical protein
MRISAHFGISHCHFGSFQNFIGKILDSFQLQKFQAQNMKVMAKEKKFIIAALF